jgi:hypothetical protein
MKIDKIDFNANRTAGMTKEGWVKMHLGICSHIVEGEREKYLSDVYERLTGSSKRDGGDRSRPKSTLGTLERSPKNLKTVLNEDENSPDSKGCGLFKVQRI